MNHSRCALSYSKGYRWGSCRCYALAVMNCPTRGEAEALHAQHLELPRESSKAKASDSAELSTATVNPPQEGEQHG
jgi:hypothetical protein